jgi:hypothetical protein
MPEASMLTVGVDAGVVECRLAAGGFACPGCAAVLAPWGHGRVRWLRGPGGARVRVRPRRSRCIGCLVTHVLLPVVALLRRADLAVLIGAALAAKAAGWGHRRIAESLGRPAATVRGWLRVFCSRAEPVRAVFTGLQVALDPDPPAVEPAACLVGDAVAAVLAAAAAVARRWPAVGALSPWETAVAVTGSRLLAPGFAPRRANTSCLWAAVG